MIMLHLEYSEEKAFSMSVDKLAFIGDAVFEIIVRNIICDKYDMNIGEINKLKVSAVCCESQANFFSKIETLLSERETSVYKRGRNAHIGSVPKKSSPQIYHVATGLEALFGYLYVSNQIERINELSKNLSL